ncbi:hypothetical protein HDV02_004030 [Globomyces sp. JEL0801]|nr:hypothetical protein HDV02_004030 [Globomyces sp. JEL0801]
MYSLVIYLHFIFGNALPSNNTLHTFKTIGTVNGPYHIRNSELDSIDISQWLFILNQVFVYNQNIKCFGIDKLGTTKFQSIDVGFMGNMFILNSLTIKLPTNNSFISIEEVKEWSISLSKGLSIDEAISKCITKLLHSNTTQFTSSNMNNRIESEGLYVDGQNLNVFNGQFISTSPFEFRTEGINSFALVQKVRHVSVMNGSNGMLSITFDFPNSSIKFYHLQAFSIPITEHSDYSRAKPYQLVECPDYVRSLIPTPTMEYMSETTETQICSIQRNDCVGINYMTNPYYTLGSYLLSFVLLSVMLLRWNILPIASLRGSDQDDNEMNDLESLKLMADEFFRRYPIGSPQARQLNLTTTVLPHSFENTAGPSISMIGLRSIPDFSFFEGFQPSIDISVMNNEYGHQHIKFTTVVGCTVQVNGILKPRILDSDTGATIDIHSQVGNDSLPPPAFSAIHEEIERLECYYQVRILYLESSDVNFVFGFVSGLYPPFRLPGFHDKSIGFHSYDSTVRIGGNSFSFSEIEVFEGDVLGIGFYFLGTTREDRKRLCFYFTFNHKRYDREFIVDDFDESLLQPAIGATRNCEVELVFGNVSKAFRAI